MRDFFPNEGAGECRAQAWWGGVVLHASKHARCKQASKHFMPCMGFAPSKKHQEIFGASMALCCAAAKEPPVTVRIFSPGEVIEPQSVHHAAWVVPLTLDTKYLGTSRKCGVVGPNGLPDCKLHQALPPTRLRLGASRKSNMGSQMSPPPFGFFGPSP